MTPLRQRMLEDLRIRDLAENTQRSYLEKIKHFAEHFGKSPEYLGPEDIRAYQIYLIDYKGDSNSQLKQFVAAARFLYLYCRRLFVLSNPKWRKLVFSFVAIEPSEFVASEFALSLADNLLLCVTLPCVMDHG